MSLNKLTAATIFLATCLAANAADATTNRFEGFEYRINPRKARQAETARALPIDPTANLLKREHIAPGKFIGWNNANPAMPMFAPDKEVVGEKMDSIVGHYLDGRLMSKQTFEYTEKGRPLMCTNYNADATGKGYTVDGYYAYEYDGLGRLVSATKVSVTGSSMMIEYIYDGDSPVYSTQIAYLPDGAGDWVPYQKGDYTMDDNYNTTEEIFSLWVEGNVNDWVPVMKNEATYDEESRLTSYFPYVWDNNTSGWVGDKSSAYEGQRFAYTQNGDDALQIDYTWENNAWLEYKHTEYTYNNAALMTMREELYWNREKQDWNGGDGYGEYGDKKWNSRDCYEYDEYGRVTLNNYYRKKKTADYVNTYRVVYEYNTLADGETEKISTESNIASDGTTTGRRVIERNNRFGSETYFAILKPNGDTYDMTEEEFRYYIPGYNWYLGFEAYRYENGVKHASGKEEFLYADDFNPEAGYQTPYEGRHYVGTQEGLKLRTVDQFTWGPRDVMTAYVSNDCMSGEQLKIYGWDVEYDFAADCSKIFMWPDSNKGAVFYENKNISSNEYYNPEYTAGSNEWNLTISSHLDYYYSPRYASNVSGTIAETDAEIVARYDIMGHPLTHSTAGINILVYSNGQVRKAFVK